MEVLVSEARSLLDAETLVSTTTLANNFQISLSKAAHCLSLLRATETSLVTVFLISGIDDSAALRYLVASGEEEAAQAEDSLVIVLSKGLFALGKISSLAVAYTNQVEAYLKQGGPFLFGGERIKARGSCLRHDRQILPSLSSSGSSNPYTTTFPACGTVATSEHAKSTSLKAAPVPSQAFSFFSRASTDLSNPQKREISVKQKDSDDEVEWEDERNTGKTSKRKGEEDGVKEEKEEGSNRKHEETSSQQVNLSREEDEEKMSSDSEEEAKESKKKRSRKKASVPHKDYSTRGAMDDFVQDAVIAQHRLDEAAGGPPKKKTRKLVEKMFTDEKGYFVTEMVYEEVTDDEANAPSVPVAKPESAAADNPPGKADKSSAKSKKNSASNASNASMQKSMMFFLTKK
eukprot:gene6361-7014_t